MKKEFVKVGEDISLEGCDGGQETTEEGVEVGKKVGVEVGNNNKKSGSKPRAFLLPTSSLQSPPFMH